MFNCCLFVMFYLNGVVIFVDGGLMIKNVWFLVIIVFFVWYLFFVWVGWLFKFDFWLLYGIVYGGSCEGK